MLGLLSMVVTAFIAWIVVLGLHIPQGIAIAVAVLLFCIDAASIVMVWYVTGRQ